MVPRLRTWRSPTKATIAYEQRQPLRDEGRELKRGVADQRADARFVSFCGQQGEIAQPVDVDQRLRAPEPHVHHRYQALTAGQDAGAAVVVLQAAHRFRDVARAVIGEVRALHGSRCPGPTVATRPPERLREHVPDRAPALGDQRGALALAPHRFGPDLEDAHVAVRADRPFDVLRRAPCGLDPLRQSRASASASESSMQAAFARARARWVSAAPRCVRDRSGIPPLAARYPAWRSPASPCRW